jgi:hypothetical protein
MHRARKKRILVHNTRAHIPMSSKTQRTPSILEVIAVASDFVGKVNSGQVRPYEKKRVESSRQAAQRTSCRLSLSRVCALAGKCRVSLAVRERTCE